jgi:hypothetical protein
METRVQTAKGKSKKGKQPKQRKNLHKITYSFDISSKRTSLYADYFDPSPEVESRLLGLSEMVRWTASFCPFPFRTTDCSLDFASCGLSDSTGKQNTPLDTAMVHPRTKDRRLGQSKLTETRGKKTYCQPVLRQLPSRKRKRILRSHPESILQTVS